MIGIGDDLGQHIGALGETLPGFTIGVDYDNVRLRAVIISIEAGLGAPSATPAP